MSGHNPPHGRLGQPNSTWNPLQVPSYIPRQPQLAHMSSERSLARSPLTWHTPATHQEQLYNFMSANHKNNLEINPMLPNFNRNCSMPLGSVDLSLSSAARSTPSPKGNNLQPGASGSLQPHPSTLPPSIPPGLGGAQMPDQNDHFHSKIPLSLGQQHHMNTNNNRSPTATQIGGVIQSTAALKDRSGHGLMGNTSNLSCNFLGGGTGNTPVGAGNLGGNGYYNMMSSSSNSSGSSTGSNTGTTNTLVGGNSSINRPPIVPISGTTPSPAMEVGSEFTAMIPGGLHIKDAKQINSEAGKNGRDNVSTNSEQSDLVKDILMHAIQTNPVSISPKRSTLDFLQLWKSHNVAQSSPLGSPLRALVPLNPTSPTRSRSPPASMVLQTVDQPSAASVNKSFQMTLANVPSTPDAVDAACTKTSTPTPSASPAPCTAVSQPCTSERTSPNQSITSNDDSADSNSSKSRRRRKPDRTNKMGSEELDRMHEFLSGGDNSADKCERIDGIDPMRPNIAVRNDIATLALEGISSLSQGLASDSSHSPHITDLSDSTRINLQTLNDTNNVSTITEKSQAVNSVISGVLSVAAAMDSARKDSESNSDDCETIDKIAAMISSTEGETAPSQIPLKLPTETKKSTLENNTNETCNGPSNDIPLQPPTPPPLIPSENLLVSNDEKPSLLQKNEADNSYEEIENKLEEMFAGIEETMPLVSKSPAPEQKTSTLTKRPIEQTDILSELSEKIEENSPVSEDVPIITVRDSPEPGTSGTQKKLTTPSVKRTSAGKPATPSTPPSKRKKVLNKKSVQVKGTGAAGNKMNKKPLSKGNVKKGNGTGSCTTNSKNSKAKSNEGNNNSLDPNSKYKGPYVQVKSDGSHIVINAPINEEDSDKPQNKTKKFSNTMNNSEKSKIRGLHVSTLSTKYDADTTDTTWMCVFCKMGPHKMRLGDLFGPYVIACKSSELEQNQTDEHLFNVKRTRDSLVAKCGPKAESTATESTPKTKKRKTGNTTPANLPIAGTSGTQNDKASEATPVDIFQGMVKAGDDSYEVWMHEDCLVWAPGVYIIGTRIVGLEAAIWNCSRHQCRICTLHGAMVSCLYRGCNAEAHIVCARKSNWELDGEFKSYCDKHIKASS